MASCASLAFFLVLVAAPAWTQVSSGTKSGSNQGTPQYSLDFFVGDWSWDDDNYPAPVPADCKIKAHLRHLLNVKEGSGRGAEIAAAPGAGAAIVASVMDISTFDLRISRTQAGRNERYLLRRCQDQRELPRNQAFQPRV